MHTINFISAFLYAEATLIIDKMSHTGAFQLLNIEHCFRYICDCSKTSFFGTTCSRGKNLYLYLQFSCILPVKADALKATWFSIFTCWIDDAGQSKEKAIFMRVFVDLILYHLVNFLVLPVKQFPWYPGMTATANEWTFTEYLQNITEYFSEYILKITEYLLNSVHSRP